MNKRGFETAAKYLSMVKFSHTIFAMPFAFIGYFLAVRQVDFSNTALAILLFQIVLCMVFARNAAMGFNRLIDRNFDAGNPRTEQREIPSGKISSKSAFWFVLLNSALFVATCFFINSLVLYLSPVALAVVLGYSYTKRFTALCHLVLGIGLSLAPIGAWLAVTGYFAWLPLFFSFAVVFWVSGFDIIYALQDEKFDKSKNLYSIPVILGSKGALLTSRIFHTVSAIFIWTAAFYGNFGILFFIGSAIYSGLLIYQQSLVSSTNLSKVNLAFFTLNGIASVVFASFVIADLYWYISVQ